MRALLSTNIKDEHNWKEWVDYHHRLGFHHILIWDDMSLSPVQCNSPNTTVVQAHYDKLTYMEKSLQFAREHRYDFMMHLDGDEYLYLGIKNDLSNFLREIPSSVISIYFPWLIFGSNHLDTSTPGSCIYPFTCRRPKTHSCIKPFVRVSSVTSVRNPHAYFYNVQQTMENTRFAPLQPIHKFHPTQGTMQIKPDKSSFFIAHYRNQSWNQFRTRKQRARDDTGTQWNFTYSLDTTTGPRIFHQDSNQVHCEIMKDAYRALLSRP